MNALRNELSLSSQKASMAKRFLRLFIRSVAALLGVMMITLLNAHAQDSKPSEYEIKAAFLYNFAKFVDWPVESFRDDSSNLTLGILGVDPFGPALDTIKDKTVRGRKITIKRSKNMEDLKGCHILFVSASEKGNLKQILNGLRDSNVLTVSEIERFANLGGIVNFIRVDNKIQFEINPEAAQRNKLKISSQLLRLARIVATESPKERE